MSPQDWLQVGLIAAATMWLITFAYAAEALDRGGSTTWFMLFLGVGGAILAAMVKVSFG